jgi:enoyl-[acyl-carrier protein] reductase I
MSFLNLENKTFLITGVANKKSVAYFVAKTLREQGAKLLLTVQNEVNFEKAKKLFPDSPVFICDVENEDHIKSLAKEVKETSANIDGMVHSIAFANFSEGPKPFHETLLKDFQQASQISCFSLVQLSNALKDLFNENSSVVTISISSTKATSYGYLGPIKAMLDSTVCYLAKSFSEFTNTRFNAVGAGPLKTSASAGIPNYIENYVYAENLTLRKKSLQTQEVANTVSFLLSERASGINGTNLLVDAGMSCNYFDQDIVNHYAKSVLD